MGPIEVIDSTEEWNKTYIFRSFVDVAHFNKMWFQSDSLR